MYQCLFISHSCFSKIQIPFIKIFTNLWQKVPYVTYLHVSVKDEPFRKENGNPNTTRVEHTKDFKLKLLRVKFSNLGVDEIIWPLWFFLDSSLFKNLFKPHIHSIIIVKICVEFSKFLSETSKCFLKSIPFTVCQQDLKKKDFTRLCAPNLRIKYSFTIWTVWR